MTHQSARILVADDDLGVIAAYRHVLEGENRRVAADESALEEDLFGASPSNAAAQTSWRVEFVDQGEDAVFAVRHAVESGDRFSVVFLDVRMPPGMDGYDTAKKIRRLDSKIHIVFVSGYSDYLESELVEVAGPERRVSFLPKPVWPNELLATTQRLCEGRRANLAGCFPRARRY